MPEVRGRLQSHHARSAGSCSATAPTTARPDYRLSHRGGIRNRPAQSSARRHCPDLHCCRRCDCGNLRFTERPKPQGAGSIDLVAAAEVPGQNMILAAITMTLRNTTKKSLWIHTLKAQLTTADGKTFEDEAASAVDLDRYFQAFPALKQNSEPPLSPETKLLAGTELRGVIIVGFKVTKEAFDQRKSLIVTIQPYDQPVPIVLK